MPLTIRELMLWTLWLFATASIAYAAHAEADWPLSFTLFLVLLAGVLHLFAPAPRDEFPAARARRSRRRG
jgi:hypothetical protein